MSNSQPQQPPHPHHPSPAGPMRIISPIALQTGIVVGSLVYSTITSTGIFAALATDQSVRFVGMGLAAGVGMTSQAVVGGLYGVAAGAAASAVATHTVQTATASASIAARNQVEMGFKLGGVATAATAGVGAGLLVTAICAGSQCACYATRCAMDALSTRYQSAVPSADFTDEEDCVLVVSSAVATLHPLKTE